MLAQVKKHILEPVNTSGSKYKYKCKVCQQEWVVQPTSICPGVRAFLSRDPKDCPPHYKTLAELEAKGLRPRNANLPSAAFRLSRRASWELLYDETKAVPERFSNTLTKLLKIGGGLGVGLLNIFITGIVSILFGFNSPSQSLTTVPLIAFVLHYPVVSLIIFCGIVLITFIGSSLFLGLTSDIGEGLLSKYIHPWSIVAATSTISFLLCFALLITVLVRLPWCPASLCPPVSATNLPGVHDANLDVYFLTFQGNAIAITGDPAHASVDMVSNERSSSTVNAVLLKNHLPSSIYRIVLVAQSLYQGRYSILIDQVALSVIDRPVIPQHLNVWVNKSLVQYDASRYSIVYRGEGPGLILPARYLDSPDGYTQLSRNEADQLDIQIISQIPVDLKFKMQVIYHIATETKRYMLLLPQVFEVVFSDQSNWYPYRLQSGHFVPTQ